MKPNDKIEDSINRADELSGGKFSMSLNMIRLQKKILDEILAACRLPDPLVSIGPKLGSTYQTDIMPWIK